MSNNQIWYVAKELSINMIMIKIISTWQKTHLSHKNNERSLNMADRLTLKFPIPEKWVPSGVCCRPCKVDYLYDSVKFLKMIKIEPHFKAVRPEIKQLSAKNGVPFSCEFHNKNVK